MLRDIQDSNLKECELIFTPNMANKEIDKILSDAEDAVLFKSFCQFIWVQGEPLPLIYDVKHPVYAKHGIDLAALKRLEAIGLVSFDVTGYVKGKFGKHTRLFYFRKPTKIQFLREAKNSLDLGHVLLTEKGKELATAGVAARNQEFYEYVIERWFRQGMVVSSILPGSSRAPGPSWRGRS